MTSLLGEPSVSQADLLLGDQRPRICHVPEYSTTTGDEAVELAAIAGLDLDDWQQFVLRHSLGERPDGKWAAEEVGLMVSRQSGKGSILEARELAGMFLLGEEFIIHSAHLFDTSANHFRRLSQRIKNTPELSERTDKILAGHGNESITLYPNEKTGVVSRIEFRTRTGMGGLGFTISLLVFDEAMIISPAMHGALLPTLSAMPNIQVWYTGSAVDEDNPAHDGTVFARVRDRGLKGDDPRLAYFEWSLNKDDPEKVGPTDERDWAKANPGFGLRILPERIEMERRAMDRRTFAVQRLGVGKWPRTDGMEGVVIDPDAWKACTDKGSEAIDPVCFAVDVQPDSAHAAICVAGHREDNLAHVEIVEHRVGNGWVVERVVELLKDHRAMDVVLDASGPAVSLMQPLEDEGVKIHPVTAREHSQACGMLYDGVGDKSLGHLGEPALLAAIEGASRRMTTGEAWLWSRRNSSVDICPLVGVTLALWGLSTLEQHGDPQVYDLNQIAREMEENGEDLSDPYA
jgi:hypothetical protein